MRKEIPTHVLYDHFNLSPSTKYKHILAKIKKNKNKCSGPSVGSTKVGEREGWKDGMAAVA
jgi:hypothetical protein